MRIESTEKSAAGREPCSSISEYYLFADGLSEIYSEYLHCSQVRYTQFTGGTMAPVYQKNIQYTLASHAVERLRPSKDTIDLMQKMSEGKISMVGHQCPIHR